MPKEDNVVLSQDDVALLVNWAGKPIHWITYNGQKLCNYCTGVYERHSSTCEVPKLQALLERIRVARPRTYAVEKE